MIRSHGLERLREEGVVELGMTVSVTGVAHPALSGAVDLQGLGGQVVRVGVARTLDPAVADEGMSRVEAVGPVTGLPFAGERHDAVAGVGDLVEVGAESTDTVVPIDILGGRVPLDVVDRVGDHVARRFRGAHGDVGVVVLGGDARRVQVVVGVLTKILLATTGVGTDSVDETGKGEGILVVVDGLDEPALVDLVELGAVLDLSRGGTSLRECGEEEAEEQGDDRHDHQKLDEREALSLSHVN